MLIVSRGVGTMTRQDNNSTQANGFSQKGKITNQKCTTWADNKNRTWTNCKPAHVTQRRTQKPPDRNIRVETIQQSRIHLHESNGSTQEKGGRDNSHQTAGEHKWEQRQRDLGVEIQGWKVWRGKIRKLRAENTRRQDSANRSETQQQQMRTDMLLTKRTKGSQNELARGNNTGDDKTVQKKKKRTKFDNSMTILHLEQLIWCWDQLIISWAFCWCSDPMLKPWVLFGPQLLSVQQWPFAVSEMHLHLHSVADQGGDGLKFSFWPAPFQKEQALKSTMCNTFF